MMKLPELKFSQYYSTEDWQIIDKYLSGLYLFYNNKYELMYIGKASYLKNRIRQHLLKNTNENTYEISHNFKYFRFVEINDIVDRDIYETYYINLLKPKLNNQKTFTYKSDKYNKQYNPYEEDRSFSEDEKLNALTKIIRLV